MGLKYRKGGWVLAWGGQRARRGGKFQSRVDGRVGRGGKECRCDKDRREWAGYPVNSQVG